MIFIGLDDAEKLAEIARYQAEHGIEKTVVISADAFPLPMPDAQQVKFSETILYRVFYPLLQTITPGTLIVINECLRTQNRYDLSYNCIRHYLNLTTHSLVFQQLPLIDTVEDFMILFDFDTQSRWKRRSFDPELVLGESQVHVRRLPLAFEPVNVPTSDRTRERYRQEKERLFRELGNRDPHTIPRNLYLISGHDKRAYIDTQSLPLFGVGGWYVARNRRLGRENIVTYAEVEPGQEYMVVELPHRFIDFSDFIRRTGQVRSRVLVADLPVDRWYFNRYADWSKRIHDTYADLSS